MVGGGGNRSSDYSKAMEKHGSASFDFRKGMRNVEAPKTVTDTEGATKESIADFVEASKAAKHAARNRLTFGERVRRFFGRS